MVCVQCGFHNPIGFAFCGKCGTSLALICEQCGHTNAPTVPVCAACGKPLSAAEERLSPEDLDHLRVYLPPRLIEELQFDLAFPSSQLLTECVTHLARLLQTTASHLPDYVVEYVRQDPTPGRAGGRFVSGTLLFADISGFTAMSERLNQIGREGAEEITAFINRTFSAMLSILRDYGGQLIKFGGDALLGLFPERPFASVDPSLPSQRHSSATRATFAAVEMQTIMEEFARTETTQGAFPLLMKVGIHSGRFFAAQLGTAGNMEYALFGNDVNATAATESAAAAGEVLLDQASYAAIDVACTTAAHPENDRYLFVKSIDSISWTPPQPQPLLPELPQPSLATLKRAVQLLDALTPYLPAGLLTRLASDPDALSLAGEHRLVGILFANVRGFGEVVDRLGPGREEQIVAALNRIMVQTMNALSQFGGVLNKIDLSDHGDKLLVLFGAPVAHEDDAERAVRVAINMRLAWQRLQTTLPQEIGLPDLRLALQIGISYGYVFAGYVGADWRHEYTVMGDQVNLSARLMSAAGLDAIFVSGNVRRKVQALFELEAQGNIVLKGKRDPVPVFAVSGLRAVPEKVRGLEQMRSSLVGRDGEWQELQTAVSQLLQQQGQIVSLTGGAGLGKSRLVEELRQQSIRSGQRINWIEGRCLSYTESVSYWVFQDLVRQLVHLEANEETAVALFTLRHALEEVWPAEVVTLNMPYLANFLNIPLPLDWENQIRYLDSEALQRRTFVALRELLSAFAQLRPLVLILDDIHWIDHASAQLLEYLLPLVSQHAVLWLLLFRPERTKTCWQIRELIVREFDFWYTEIELVPLSQQSARQLLQNLVGNSPWPPGIQELLLERTEGNPLYLEEVLRALINDSSLIDEGGGRWRVVGDVGGLNVPDTLQGVMMARLDRLSEQNRWTAQVASIVGRVFPFAVLSHIAAESLEAEKLSPRLVRLQQYEIIEETQRAPELVYSFMHTLMQEVCYSSMAVRSRRKYHRRIADYLEENRVGGWGDAKSILPIIAHHAYVGQHWETALRYQIQSGWQAKQLFANHEAIDHFQKALECTGKMPATATGHARLVILGSLGELMVKSSQYEEAYISLIQAHGLARELEDVETEASVCHWVATSYERQGKYTEAVDWVDRGLAALHGRKTTESVHLLLIGGQTRIRLGEYEAATDLCRQALTLARTLGEITARARANNLLGITYLRSDSQQAITRFQEAFALYRQAGDLYGEATSHNLIANAYFNLGHWRQADDHYRQARTLFAQLGDIYFAAGADNNLGGLARNRGRLDEAISFYEEALRAFAKIGASDHVLGLVEMNLGATYIRRDELEPARRYLQSSQRRFEEAQSREFLPELYRHQAHVALLTADLADAEGLATRSLRLARELAMRGEEGSTLALQAEVARARQQHEAAETLLRDSTEILDEAGEEYQLARSRVLLAQTLIDLDHQSEAIRLLEKARAVFVHLDARLDLSTVQQLQQKLEKSH